MPSEMVRSVLCAIAAMGTLVWSTFEGLAGRGTQMYSLLLITFLLLGCACYRAVPRMGP